MISRIVFILFSFNALVLTFVGGLLISERSNQKEYFQAFEIGEVAMVSRGYFKGCDFKVRSYDAKYGEYSGTTGKCVVKARKHESDVFNENELVHKLGSN